MSELSPEIKQLLEHVPTAALSGNLYKKHGLRSRAIRDVRPLNPANCRFAGPAFTIRYVPQREDLNVSTDLASPNSLLLRATEEIPPGAVFIMDMMGNRHVGGLGDVLVSHFIKRGIAAVVADGGMRDVGELRDMALPVFCAGAAAPPGPASIIPVGIQEPVSCGGIVVFPGDMVVGDDDGVVVIPEHLISEVVSEAADKEKQDAWVRQQVEQGSGVRGLYPPDAEHLAMYRKFRDG